jgi:predicted CoA-binding protein
MTSKAAVDGFIAERTLAIVGVSRSGKKFGNMILKELSAKGYRMLPVHPEATTVGPFPASPSLAALPEKPGGVVVVVPPARALQVVRDAHAAGITRVWLQQGASSPDAIRFCEEQGMSVVHGECLLMFADPAGFFHRAHRWVWNVIGKLPT